MTVTTVIAGIPNHNMTLYHRMRFGVGDPVGWLEWTRDGVSHTLLIIRDIEMERARAAVSVDRVACPKDFEPDGGLSGDREIATAQAVAEAVVRNGFNRARSDRSLPLSFLDQLRQRGIEVDCDYDLGILDRRAKDSQEIEKLRIAQHTTECAMRLACETIAAAEANADGVLEVAGEALTSERVRAIIDGFFLDHGYSAPPSIVAGGVQGAECHDIGHGPLRTGEPVIVDIFPRDNTTLYNGDCTRTVVHGDIPEAVQAMHAVVVESKNAAEAVVRAGVTGQSVHEAAIGVIRQHGYAVGLPSDTDPPEYCGMVHGTGHGIGLEVHEPPLLDFGGPELMVGDALTIEPGLYSRALGGIRVEDMVIVKADGCENLNTLPTGLDWRD
ncbi:MAG: Xaa-Pro peptidase family protein [Phycisphaerales bacterium]|nr:Xaa-Pro peptidase family protein [Phycisphaerales bacterium]